MKRAAYFLAAAAALAAGGAEAQSRHGLELGGEIYRYDYEETFEGRRIVEDEGRLFGLDAAYGQPFGAWDFQVKGRAAGGLVDYESDEGDRLNDVAQASVQLELTFGRPFRASPSTWVTPFAGLGARGHGDDSGGLVTDTGLEGYDRYIFYAYAPLGVTADVRTGPKTSLSFTGQYNLFLGGEAESEFSALGVGAPDVRVDLEDGSGWAFSAAAHWQAGRGRVSFGPFVRTWDIDRSASAVFEEGGEGVEIFEPDNRTIEAGARLAYRF